MKTQAKTGDEPGPMSQLVALLCHLPGVNAHQALRITAQLASEQPEQVENLAHLMETARNSGRCPECGGLSEEKGQPCAICDDPTRTRESLCVVEQPGDLAAVERSGAYGGRYHIIDRLLSAKGETQVEETGVPNLVQRVKDAAGEIEEVIVATDPSPDGNYTADYVAEALSRLPSPPKVTRPAMGLPSGSGPEFVDETTVRQSIRDRRPA